MRPDCLTLRSAHFAPLKGSLDEAREVARLWRQSLGDSRAPSAEGDPVILLTGAEANEAAFKRRARGQQLVHLATHGFVLDPECQATPPGSRGIGVLLPDSSAGTVDVENFAEDLDPLLSSGFAQGGANRRAQAGPDEEDGILTAQEIAALDLDGTRPAVLSACETGTGMVLNGEGVFGLRRALAMAGVHTLVTSLWAVQDEDARAWMTAFYRILPSGRWDAQRAAERASLEILEARRSDGRPPHPFYWAAFLAAP